MGVAIVAIAFAAFNFMGPSEDEKHWEKALTSNTLEDFDFHVQNFDECTHKELAAKKITSIVKDDNDNIDWKKIQNSIDFIDFEKHLESFPNCSHTNLANTKIASLANEIKDKHAWDKVLEEKSETAIKSYLKEFPRGKHTQQATILLTEFNIEKQDWNAAVKANSVSAYTNYLKKYPEGVFSADANSKLNVINAASTRRRDVLSWNQIARYTNTTYYIKAHLRSFKNCIHKTEANKKISAIDYQMNYYKNVSKRPIVRTYYGYINKFGGKKAIYYASARYNIKMLASKSKSIGWIWQGRTTKDKSRLTSYNYYNLYSNSHSQIPVVGDLMKSRSKLTIYAGADGGKKTSYVTQRDEVVVALEVKIIDYSDHSGCWVRVAKI